MSSFQIYGMHAHACLSQMQIHQAEKETIYVRTSMVAEVTVSIIMFGYGLFFVALAIPFLSIQEQD